MVEYAIINLKEQKRSYGMKTMMSDSPRIHHKVIVFGIAHYLTDMGMATDKDMDHIASHTHKGSPSAIDDEDLDEDDGGGKPSCTP